MAERTFPLDNIQYYAEDMRMFHAGRYGGIVNYTGDDFGLRDVNGMRVSIDEGIAFLKTGNTDAGGVVYRNDAISNYTFSTASSYVRYDWISIRYDNQQNNVYMKQYTGNTSKPIPLRDGNVWELILYIVEIPANAGRIERKNIIDCRMNEEFCGLSVDTMAKIPTQAYDSQFSDFMEEIKDKYSDIPVGALDVKIDSVKEDLEQVKDDYLKKTGGTMTGELYAMGDIVIPADPSKVETMSAPASGTISTQITGLESMADFKTFFGYVNTSKGNYILESIRNRNGFENDEANATGYIIAFPDEDNASMNFKVQRAGSWQDTKVVVDSSNYKSVIPEMEQLAALASKIVVGTKTPTVNDLQEGQVYLKV